MEKMKRGGQEKDVYKGRDVTKALLKVPEYIVFKRWADSKGLSVTEMIYKILENELEKYKDEKSTSINGISKGNS